MSSGAKDIQLYELKDTILQLNKTISEQNGLIMSLQKMLEELPLPETDREEARVRMERQRINAREWRDVINTFFYRLSGIEDGHGRVIFD